ncbi:DUF2147 domain-containing protein [Caulobacter sp.]|uniref:DUF2147 domain-containing protein n=1 Tax=Caulobacter sp. TaxID=78 RepID=UPI003BADA713
MLFRMATIASVASLTLITAAEAQAASPEGVWVTASGNVEVKIAPCAKVLCGDVVKVLANRSMADPSAEVKGSPAKVGLRILSELQRSDSHEWKGKIFNRENGKTYDCIVKSRGETLEVRPYVGVPAMGKTQIWTRASPAN